MNQAIHFLQSQKILCIACHNEQEIWSANVYMGVATSGNIYFISPKNAKHSKMISKNPTVAFSCAWSNEENPQDRKGIQGIGTCTIVNNVPKIIEGLTCINKNFPVFRSLFTLDWIKTNKHNSKVWCIAPSYIKYWDDTLYQQEESAEFHFPKVT